VAEPKTARNDASVDAFIDAIEDDARRDDCRTLVRIMKQAVGVAPAMWGPSIVGFGSYHYKYESGREGDWFLAGFSPRKQNLTLYIMAGFERYETLMAKLGRHTTGKSCLYIKRLSDIDTKVLKELVTASARHMKSRYPSK
jgi:Domain of unknown function (DU1801)